MAEIIYLGENGLKKLEVCTRRKYFLIGRYTVNDLVISDAYVSRFHATIFSYNKNIWLIDHSINGTHYNSKGKDFGNETVIPNVTGTKFFKSFKSRVDKEAGKQMNDSVRELKKSEEEGKVSRIPDFVMHKFARLEDIAYILRMIDDNDQIRMLCSCARRINDGGYIGIPILDGRKILEISI